MNSSGSGPGDRTRSSAESTRETEYAGGASYPSDGWLRTVLENTSDVICVLGADGTFLYISPAIEKVLGYLPEDLIGAVSFDYVHPDDASLVAESYAEILQTTGVHAPVEFRVQGADGSVHHVQAVPNNQLDNPLLRGVVVTFRDLTERVRMEEKVRSQARLLDAVGQAVIATDWQGKIVYWNRAAEELYGWSAEEAMGRSGLEATAPESLWEREDEIMSELRALRSWSGEYEMRRKNGTLFHALITITPMLDDEDNLAGIIGISTDISKRKEAEEELKRLSRRHQLILNSAGEGIYGVDREGTTTFVNPAAAALTGFEPDELIGQHLHDIVHHSYLDGTPYPEMDCPIYAALRDGETHQVSDEVFWRKDGTSFPVEYTSTPILEGGEITGAVVTFTDVTERKTLEEELRRRASHDRLTGLPNRDLFMDRLRQALERTRRRKARKVAVLFMDLDGFKVINDSLGHEVGDLLLVVVTQRLRRCLRPEDTLARFGGDEFVVLLEEVEDPEEAARVAERITHELRRPFLLEGRELFASISIGIALGNARQKTPEDLLRDADTAMYWVKEGGSGYRVFDPAMYERAVRRLDLANDLRRAVEVEELVLHYQPMISLQTGDIVGLEALARWNHPERGLLAPTEFISISEETGMIIPLGRWVINEACRQAKEWQRLYPTDSPPPMSVNLSARQLHDPNIVAEVADALEGVGLDPRSLMLEITESVLVEDRADTDDKLRALKDLGLGLTMDDFGTGYSSFSYLKYLPIDRLKIDRTFVGGLSTDRVNSSIVKAAVMLGHAIGIEVAAEGVETMEELEALRTHECDIAQGYHWWEPCPAEETSALLAPDFSPGD